MAIDQRYLLHGPVLCFVSSSLTLSFNLYNIDRFVKKLVGYHIVHKNVYFYILLSTFGPKHQLITYLLRIEHKRCYTILSVLGNVSDTFVRVKVSFCFFNSLIFYIYSFIFFLLFRVDHLISSGYV